MKNIMTVFIGLILAANVIGQEVTYNSIDKMNEAKLNGVFEFTFDDFFTLEQLTKASDFYTDHFSAEYTPKGNGLAAKFTILTKEPMSRKVLSRYFSTLEIQKIIIDGTSVELGAFLDKFVMLPK